GILIPDVSYVGYYKIAFAIVFSVGGLLSFTNVLLPVFLKLSNQGLSEAVSKTIRYVSLLSIPSIFGVLALGKYFIYVLSGSYSYLPAALPLYFLAFLIFEISMTAIFSTLYSIKEKPEILVKFVVFATILNIALNFILILSLRNFSYAWATAGAAIATLISRYLLLIVFFFNSKSQFKIEIKNTRLLTILLASLIMFLVLLGLNSLIRNMSIFIGILEIILGISVYTIVILLSKVIYFSDIKKIALSIIKKK
ncbi:MAG: polysaccharide biosynthesis C-terminal domain-containing protein, partial [Candidatus Pacearchaeota archaeon]|nr:polysaccharide biosynthesis C-terminal domain-containing protein [Candidatus Pacearchaeota archaeon]